MSIVKIIGKNIKKLMDESNTSARRISEVIGVTHPTVLKYINGEQAIDSEKLYIIAEYFKKDFDYFFSDDSKKLSLMFRADKPSVNLEQSDCEFILKKMNQYIEISDDRLDYIPQSYSISVSEAKLSDFNESTLEKIALEQRRLFGIEYKIPENYFSVISDVGINALCFEIQNDTLFGASSYSKEHGSFIFINCNEAISEERQIFSLIHELGHLIFHRNEYQDPKYSPFYEKTRGNIKEKIADTFAGYFLLPRDLLKKYVDDRKGKISVIEMKNHFKVSIQALYMALKKYSMISDDKYREFWKKVNTNGWSKTEPNPIERISFEKKNEKLFLTLRNLYEKGEISVDDIADVLSYKYVLAEKLVKDWSKHDDELETI